ncbi:META domain-containing protein [Pseudoruegeria sp. HB172150]|uniref:META domain-containing protein n=1 Tax=Pseudoruegeria sp. HB172150 TaxID=2721164 RepID=UPI00155325B3|nr:META domain-containing protein [Pseudoruegeria sp. HB172150]
MRPAIFCAAIFALAEPVNGAEWRIVAVDGFEALGEPEIRFDPDGTITGSTGCNEFVGRGRTEATSLVIDGNLALTRKACTDLALTRQEATIGTLLQGSIELAFDPFGTTMTLSRDGTSLALVTGDDPVRSDPSERTAMPLAFNAPYLNVQGLRGNLNLRNAPSTEGEVVAKITVGTMLSNQGCQQGAEHDWCEVQTLDETPTQGWAAAEYLQPVSAERRADEGLFDRTGRLSCKLGGNNEPLDCDYGVATDRDLAVLTVYLPSGSARVMFFADGGFAYHGSANATVETVEDIVRVSIGDERYEIPVSEVSPG